MLDLIDRSDSLRLEDLLDDLVVTSPGGPESVEFAEETPAETLRTVDDRTQDLFEGGSPHLLGQAKKMPETFGSDLDVVQRAA